MIPTRATETTMALLFSTRRPFSAHLTKWEDDQLPDKYDHNTFEYAGQPDLAEVRQAAAYQRQRGDRFLKLEGDAPLANAFGLTPSVTLTMLLSADADPAAWRCNPAVAVRAPLQAQVETLERKHFGPLYGEAYTVRNIRRLWPRMRYYGAYCGDTLVASCHACSVEGFTCIDGLIVDTPFRNQAVATTLLRAIALAARARGDAVFLHADEDDTPKNIYAKLGFTVVDKLYEYLCTDLDTLSLT